MASFLSFGLSGAARQLESLPRWLHRLSSFRCFSFCRVSLESTGSAGEQDELPLVAARSVCFSTGKLIVGDITLSGIVSTVGASSMCLRGHNLQLHAWQQGRSLDKQASLSRDYGPGPLLSRQCTPWAHLARRYASTGGKVVVRWRTGVVLKKVLPLQ